MASMITDRPGVTSTMEAAARAASVAPDTAKPQSAFFSAGASLTPSPVMPTIWPCFCRTSTMWNCVRGRPVRSHRRPRSPWRPPPFPPSWSRRGSPPSRMFEPMPRVLAVSRAIASASPVTILIFTPIFAAVAMVSLASTRGGSKRGNTPRKRHFPSSSARATPSARKPRAAKSFTALSTASLTAAALAERPWMTCGAPLVTLKDLPSFLLLTVASVRLCTGSNGVKCVTS